MDNNSVEKLCFGKVFGSNIVFASYLVLFLSIFIFLEKPIFGLIILIISLFLALTDYGVILYFESNTYKEYTRYFGILTKGKSRSYNDFHYITFFPTKKSFKMYTSTSIGNTVSEYYYSVYILSENLRKKVELFRTDDSKRALKKAKYLSQKMNKEYFDYDPKFIRQKMTSK